MRSRRLGFGATVIFSFLICVGLCGFRRDWRKVSNVAGDGHAIAVVVAVIVGVREVFLARPGGVDDRLHSSQLQASERAKLRLRLAVFADA